MSSKKDNFKLSNRKLMKLAIRLASNQKYLTGINPSVGCVITNNNKILSYGVTGFKGKPHAEVSTIKKLKKFNLKNSKMLVTLEPCTHYGKTPPCTNSIIKSKIKNVIFSHTDEDLRTKNKATKILNDKKINVTKNFLNKETSNLYKEYDFIKKYNRPYLISKLAVSSNHKILSNKTPITNIYSREIAHILRYRNHALLTSYKTINNDNPKLDCRLNGLEKYSPDIIIVDKNLKIRPEVKILKKKSFKKIIFHNCTNKKKIKSINTNNVKLIKAKIHDNNLDLPWILNKLYQLGYHRVLLESGPTLIHSFFKKKLINEFCLFKSDKPLNSIKNIDVNHLISNLNNYFKNNKIKTFISSDKLINYY